MKKYIYATVAIIGFTATLGFAKSITCKKNTNFEKTAAIIGIEQKLIEGSEFKGIGLFQDLTEDKISTDLRVSNIQLSPKSYFDWHSLPGGNIIIVTDGTGFYQSKGKPVIKIEKGDKLETIPGLLQWIGSSADSNLEFISITTQKKEDLIHWHENLPIDTYNEIVKDI